MENNSNFFLAIMVGMLMTMLIAIGVINSKLYDIREHINGTCLLKTTYNGTCK